MQQDGVEQDVPVGQPYGQGGAGAPPDVAGAGAPESAAGAPRKQSGDEARRPAAPGAPRRRERQAVQRPHRLTPRFSDEELEDVRLAALVSGLTPTGYVAKVAVDASAQRVRPVPSAVVDALEEFLVARRQVQRFGVLVNQAVAKWHATEQLPGELTGAVALVARVLLRLEAAAAAVRQAHDRAPRRPTVAERLAALEAHERRQERGPGVDVVPAAEWPAGPLS